jgi:hypothetical protein
MGCENLAPFPPWAAPVINRPQVPTQSTERHMRTTSLSSCVLYSWLCWLPSSCESSIGIPIVLAIVLLRVRTELDWEFASLYSVAAHDG